VAIPQPGLKDYVVIPGAPIGATAAGYVSNGMWRTLTSSEAMGTAWEVSPVMIAQHVFYWGIRAKDKWGDVRGLANNALAIEQALFEYPWPAPANLTSRFFMKFARGDLREYARAEALLSPKEIRSWLTLSFTKHYASIMKAVEEYLEEREEKDKRNNLVKTVASTAVIGLMTAGAGIAAKVAAGTLTAGATTMEKVKAAKGMAKTAEQHKKSDQAFSEEVDRVADEIDQQAAEEERASAPTDKETEAIVQNEGVYHIVVNGQVVAETRDAADIEGLIKKYAKPGDYVKILFNGQVIKHIAVTDGGAAMIPTEYVPTYEAMTPEERLGLVEGATQAVQAQKKPTLPWWAIALPVGAIAVISAS
jgi:hypothetical protein